MSTFGEDKISDQKRLVRGEHYLAARGVLRARDEVHNRPWRVLTLAGAAPRGEIGTIRELMPKATIVMVDRDRACLEAAIDAGADDVVQCDLAEFQMVRRRVLSREGNSRRFVHPSLERYVRSFDIVNLDLCGHFGAESRDIVRVNQVLLNLGGVLMVTVSYGRDVIESHRLARANASAWQVDHLTRLGAPIGLVDRLCYLLNQTQASKLRSVMLYRGASMPMCSLLICSNGGQPSFVQVEAGDYELAVVYPGAAELYDCPQGRIESLRRQFAALKAAHTRRTMAS